MKTIWQIFCRDIHSLATHFFALLVAVAIALLPSLYAWLNIYANWDPYGNTGNISIAVASLDEGCTGENGETVNEGQELVRSLHDSVSVNWVVMEDADAAVEGVRAGDYYAAVVIGEKFSYQLNHMLTDWSGKPTITYYQNDKKNAVATKITDTAVSALRQRISESYLNVLIGDIFREAGGLSQNLTETDPEGSLLELLIQTRGLVRSCDDTLEAFASAPLLSTDGTALDKLVEKGQISDGVALDSVAELDRRMYESLDKVNDALTQARQAIEDYANGTGGEVILQAADKAVAKAAQAAGDMGERLQSWSETIAGIGDPVGSRASEEAAALSEQFYELQSRLTALPPLVNEQENIAQLVEDCLTLTEGIGVQIKETMVPSQEDLTENVHQVTAQAQRALDGLQGTAADVQTLLQQAGTTAQAVNGSLAEARQGIQQASAKLSGLLDELSNRGEWAYLDTLVELLGGEPEVYGAYFAQVVQTQVEEIYPIANYGSAMAPFYTVLAIWVGSVILVAVIKAHARRDGLINPTPAQLFFGRYLLFLLLSQIQAAVILTGNLLLLGVQCLHPGLLYLTGALTSLTFSLLIYALTVSFGDVGKAIVVVIMVLQIAGSGGTFPIELLPEFYQKVYRLFPFPYAIDAMRECVSGLYGACWAVNIGKLLIFAAAGLLIGLLVRRPFMGLNAFVEEKLEETELL